MTLLLCFNGLFSAFLNEWPLIRTLFLPPESFSHPSPCHFHSCVLHLLPHLSSHPNVRSRQATAWNGFWTLRWFPGALSRHRLSNRKKYPFPRRDRAVNSHSVCYALYPEMSIPPLSRASFPPLSLSCSHSSGACSISFWFWTSLMSNALRYSCPSVSSVLLASGFCLLFWLFCNLWGWAVTGKRQISALPSWTGVMNNCFL